MTRKNLLSLVAFVTLAAAGTAAQADDITIANESFMSTKTRAEVRAETIAAREAGQVFASEVDLSSTMPAKQASVLSRANVRAELLKSPRTLSVMHDWAA